MCGRCCGRYCNNRGRKQAAFDPDPDKPNSNGKPETGNLFAVFRGNLVNSLDFYHLGGYHITFWGVAHIMEGIAGDKCKGGVFCGREKLHIFRFDDIDCVHTIVEAAFQSGHGNGGVLRYVFEGTENRLYDPQLPGSPVVPEEPFLRYARQPGSESNRRSPATA